MELLQDLNWRYAVKKYSNERVPEDKLNFILEAINLSASSTGLQPYRLFVIDNAALKSKLGATSFNGQIAESSHLLVFAAYNEVSTAHIQEMIELTAQTRNIAAETLDGLSTMMNTHFKSRTEEQNKHWAEKQTYIALGTALVAAANVRVDATPMEGFDADLFDEVLQLKEKGLHSTVILSLGYRDASNDFLANAKKVRIPLSEMITHIK